MNKCRYKYDFAVFILTHGRANTIITHKTLRRHGYTGQIFFIIDNEDNQIQDYKDKFGNENVVIFDKKRLSDQTDEADNFDDRRTITHARNATFEIAKDLSVRQWIQLDDDYTKFDWRFYEKGNPKPIMNLDFVFSRIAKLHEITPAKSIAIAQGGDFIGGAGGSFQYKGLARKCMNSFICSNDKKFTFLSRLNEDVCTYLSLGNTGDLFFTYTKVSLTQKQTQANNGGISEAYRDSGTYVKSFYSVMFCPSFVKVGLMKSKHKRLHHSISWKFAVPKIISEEYKK
jgi:hypothetical protein